MDALSLTGYLDARDSHIGSFFRKTFPCTRAPLRECREALQAFPPLGRLPDNTPSHVYGYLGTAIDYRIRYHFAHMPWTELAATEGAGLVSFRSGASSASPTTYVPEEPVHRVEGIPPEVINRLTGDMLAQHLGVLPEPVDRPTRIHIGPLPGGRVARVSIGSTSWVPEDQGLIRADPWSPISTGADCHSVHHVPIHKVVMALW